MDIKKQIIYSNDIDKKLMLMGPTGSGKSTLLFERYKYMVEDLNIPSDSILILLLNRAQSLEWRKKTILKTSSNIWRTSYYGFIQKELNIFYPILLKNCNGLIKNSIKPTFLTFESAQFLLSKVIEYRREKNGTFSTITSYTDKIAIDLASNLVKASTSDILFSEIGDRLYNSLEIKDDIKKNNFLEITKILKDYRNKCFSLGVIDFGMAVELYNNYLLSDAFYLEHLSKRVRHLIVDNIEECVPSLVDFISLILPNTKSCLLGYNNEGGYGKSFGGNHNYVKQKLIDIDSIQKINLEDCHTCSSFMYEFSDMLFDNINNLKNNKYKKNIFIERHPSVELRSEMLEKVGELVCKLVHNEGYSPSQIAIMSTYSDPVTEFVISRILEKQQIKLTNLSRNNRVIDNMFSQALITLAYLCHPKYKMLPNKDDVKTLIQMVLGIDPIRSSILAGEVMKQHPYAEFPEIELIKLIERVGYRNIEKYNYIKNWISEYKRLEPPLPINEFFQKVFLELLISKDTNENDILQAKKLIDSAQSFVEIVSKFNRNASKDFLDMVRRGVKSAESMLELEEKLSSEFVIISTPIAYLASNLKHKVIILTSLSSKNWTPRNMKELTNVHVLTKTWDANDIYTEEIEEKNQKEFLAIVLRAILKRCGERLITLESNLSSNGYENDGILSQYFDNILSISEN